MSIRPTGSRVLVKPDDAPTETESGIEMVRDLEPVPVSGTVVALGIGPEHDAQVKREIMQDIRQIVETVADIFPMKGGAAFTMLRDELGRYGAQRPASYEYKVGDRVAFPVSAGQVITQDGEVYVLLMDEDIIAVVDDDEEEAEAVA